MCTSQGRPGSSGPCRVATPTSPSAPGLQVLPASCFPACEAWAGPCPQVTCPREQQHSRPLMHTALVHTASLYAHSRLGPGLSVNLQRAPPENRETATLGKTRTFSRHVGAQTHPGPDFGRRENIKYGEGPPFCVDEPVLFPWSFQTGKGGGVRSTGTGARRSSGLQMGHRGQGSPTGRPGSLLA